MIKEGTKSKLICPYCMTHLIHEDSTTFWCECHPLKKYESQEHRLFSWRIRNNGVEWDYIPKNGDFWAMNYKGKLPTKRLGFVFR